MVLVGLVLTCFLFLRVCVVTEFFEYRVLGLRGYVEDRPVG